MSFNLAGWSAFYKTAKGEGTITCDNGQSIGVTRIDEGHGAFSPVSGIGELLGSYAHAEAHAGAVKSVAAQALTKGEVSLALSGKGSGVDIGFDFWKFTIRRRGSP